MHEHKDILNMLYATNLSFIKKLHDR